ncbi:MAG: hypothetical protein KAJ19_27060, partial [Gammaproteobacteria bacterium]|nr:hypothetical protein [Gammaproteobacteria bacterium]
FMCINIVYLCWFWGDWMRGAGIIKMRTTEGIEGIEGTEECNSGLCTRWFVYITGIIYFKSPGAAGTLPTIAPAFNLLHQRGLRQRMCYGINTFITW